MENSNTHCISPIYECRRCAYGKPFIDFPFTQACEHKGGVIIDELKELNKSTYECDPPCKYYKKK